MDRSGLIALQMSKGLLLVFLTLLSYSATADSFRCGRSVVKVNDSSNTLMKKCGKPLRKYTAYESINNHGRVYDAGVTNWVYERTRKKDMIVSVRNGVILKIRPD